MRGQYREAYQGKKSKNNKKSITFDKFCLKDQDVHGALVGVDTFNCRCTNGVLRFGVGMKRYKINGKDVAFSTSEPVVGCYLLETGAGRRYQTEKKTFYCMTDGGNFYAYDTQSSSFVNKGKLLEGARSVVVWGETGEYCTVLSGKDNYYHIRNDMMFMMPHADANGTICVCKNRVFLGKDIHYLTYTQPRSPWTFSNTFEESGEVALAYGFGKIVALITFDNRVYAFMQRGVVEVNVGGSDLDFVVQPLHYSGGEIYGRSVGVCANAIFFLATDGVYKFDGKKFSKVAKHLTIIPKRGEERCWYAVVGENYLLRYIDEKGFAQTAVIDADGKEGFFTLDKEGLSLCGDQAICFKSGYFYVIEEDEMYVSGERARFVSASTDLHTSNEKIVTKIRIEGYGSGTIALVSEAGKISKSIKFTNGCTTMETQMQGKEFHLEFHIARQSLISKVTLEYIEVE